MTEPTLQEQTYLQLFDKYSKRDRDRSVLTIISGTLAVAGIALAALRLRELQADRRLVLAAAVLRWQERTP